MTSIHPTAIVEDGARLGAGCVIHAYAIVTRHCVLGDGVIVHPFVVVGGDPQDLGFDTSHDTTVHIGARTVLREHVSVSRATKPGTATEIGEDCFLMACSHLGHDGRVGNRVILAQGALLAGHVHVGDRAFIGGGAAIHQYCRIGESAMIGGGARIAHDVPPFVMVAERDEVAGLNVVGIRRRGLAREAVLEIKRAYHDVFRPTGNLRDLAAGALAGGGYHTPEALRFLEFLTTGKRGFVRRGSQAAVRQDDA